MTDSWLERMSAMIDPNDHNPGSIHLSYASSMMPSLFKNSPQSADNVSKGEHQKEDVHMSKPDIPTTNDNLELLKRLRQQPRGTQVEARIAAVRALLGENEVFKTLKMLRWPQGVICPRCHSTNVVRRDPPSNAVDLRHHYECLNCKGKGGMSDFDDLTGFPMASLYSLRQWILCWYLLGFCSIAQISKVLGIGINEVLQMASVGSELTELPSQYRQEQTLKETKEHEKKARAEYLEDVARSDSKSPLRPGYKSKK